MTAIGEKLEGGDEAKGRRREGKLTQKEDNKLNMLFLGRKEDVPYLEIWLSEMELLEK